MIYRITELAYQEKNILCIADSPIAALTKCLEMFHSDKALVYNPMREIYQIQNGHLYKVEPVLS